MQHVNWHHSRPYNILQNEAYRHRRAVSGSVCRSHPMEWVPLHYDRYDDYAYSYYDYNHNDLYNYNHNDGNNMPAAAAASMQQM